MLVVETEEAVQLDQAHQQHEVVTSPLEGKKAAIHLPNEWGLVNCPARQELVRWSAQYRDVFQAASTQATARARYPE